MAPPRSSPGFLARHVPGARVAAMPRFVEPALAKLVPDAPAGPRWLHEIKYDGYRAQAHLRSGKAKVYTRRGHDWTDRFRSVAGDIERLPVIEAVIDGEICAVDDSGQPNYELLLAELGAGRTARLVYYVFDLLYLDSFDLRRSPLLERKRVLQPIVSQAKQPTRIHYSDHMLDNGEAMLRQACEMGLEGIISKLADGSYRSGRTDFWRKVKCKRRDRFVIVGFIPKRTGFEALYLGRRVGRELVYAGKVGTGFTAESAQQLRMRLDTIMAEKSPFTEPLRKPKARWVRPQLEAEIDYLEISADGTLRHPSFKGLAQK